MKLIKMSKEEEETIIISAVEMSCVLRELPVGSAVNATAYLLATLLIENIELDKWKPYLDAIYNDMVRYVEDKKNETRTDK